MTRLSLSAALLLAFSATASAVQPLDRPTPNEMRGLDGVTPTPEMWFYNQALQQYNDPRVAVRQKSEFAAQQRQQRIAAQTWYGVSRSRPNSNPTISTNGAFAPMYMPVRTSIPATQINVVQVPARSAGAW